ncbi:MAG: VOC family protein [Synechococcaceae cyanobacterium]|jgi:extradiol dioxygenase family protein
MSQPLFHLSIPAVDLEATKQWYVEGLGCGVGRRSVHALILDLGGHQLVAQKQPPQHNHPPQVGIYPRHFGLVFRELATWQALCNRVRAAGLSFAVEPKLRFAGEITEHHTFFLIDPSGNWLEFKHYSHPEAVLGCHEVDVVGDDSQRADPQRLPARLLEFLKFGVLASLRQLSADCRHAGRFRQPPTNPCRPADIPAWVPARRGRSGDHAIRLSA